MILNRFSYWIDINISSECAGMYQTSEGIYCKVDEAEEQIDYLLAKIEKLEAESLADKDKITFLVSALQSLKACNAKLQPVESLNDFVDQTLHGYL